MKKFQVHWLTVSQVNLGSLAEEVRLASGALVQSEQGSRGGKDETGVLKHIDDETVA